MRNTKIVCTLGPASWSLEKIHELIAAGMNVARLNFSHGTYEEHARMIRDVRAAASEAGVVVGILQDLQGPKIRLGVLVQDVKVSRDDEVVFGEGGVPVDCDGLVESVKVGMEVVVGDGAFLGEVVRVDGGVMVVKAVADGVLQSHKGFAVRGADFVQSALTEKDLRDLEFGLSIGVDMVALSFVKEVQDVLMLRGKIATYAAKHGIADDELPMVVVKIERHEAVVNADAILAAADAVMIARGDLGLDVSLAQVPTLQKELVAKCRMLGKPVIVATQMMESMIVNPVPTRAEVSDVANAVYEHVDAVMLSGETANGQFPVEAVRMMAEVVSEAEVSKFDDVVADDAVRQKMGRDELVMQALDCSEGKKRVICVCPGEIGVIRRIAATRPAHGLIGCAASLGEAARMQMSWGVTALVVSGGDVDRAEILAAIGEHVLVNPITEQVVCS